MDLTKEQQARSDALIKEISQVMLKYDLPAIAHTACLIYLAGLGLNALCISSEDDRAATVAWAIDTLHRSMDLSLQHCMSVAAHVLGDSETRQ